MAAAAVVDGQPACSASEPWLTSVRGLVSYTIPKIDVLVSAILRSQANVQPGADVATNGASRAANFLMTAAQFQAATGRSLRAGVTTETVNILLPGSDLRRSRQQPRHSRRQDLCGSAKSARTSASTSTT